MSLITISENWGCGGKKIAENIAKKLNLELFDDARLQEEALNMGVAPKDLKGLEEKLPGFFDRLFGQTPDVYLNIMQSVVYKVARQGQGVIVGHGSQILLRDFSCAFHVRIYASEKSRIDNITTNQKISRETALKLIHRRDKESTGFFKYAFNLDYDDPALYDLIINTEKINTDTAALHIAQLAGSDEMKACSLAALESMERLSLEKSIHSELLKNGVSPKLIYVEVMDSGVARLYGVAMDRDLRSRVVSIVEKMPAVSKVISEIVVVSDSGL